MNFLGGLGWVRGGGRGVQAGQGEAGGGRVMCGLWKQTKKSRN